MEVIKYFSEDLSAKQKLASCITGYEDVNSPFTSAQDGYYYSTPQDAVEQRLDHLKSYAENVCDIFTLSREDLLEVDRYCAYEVFDGTQDQHNRFDALSDQKTSKSKTCMTVSVDTEYYKFLKKESFRLSVEENSKVSLSDLVRRGLNSSYPKPVSR